MPVYGMEATDWVEGTESATVFRCAVRDLGD